MRVWAFMAVPSTTWTLITDDYRYIRTYDDRELNQVIFEELYDQHQDKYETQNLAKIKEYENVIHELGQKIDLFERNTLNN